MTDPQNPAAIAAQLLANFGPPPASAPANSADLSLSAFPGDGYIKQSNLTNFQRVADGQNRGAWDNYQTAVKNWALNETQRRGLGLASQAPPAPPQYVAVDVAGFNNWWNLYSESFDARIAGAPPTSQFLKPAPAVPA